MGLLTKWADMFKPKIAHEYGKSNALRVFVLLMVVLGGDKLRNNPSAAATEAGNTFCFIRHLPSPNELFLKKLHSFGKQSINLPFFILFLPS